MLFVLRVLSALVLMTLLGILFVAIWREYQATLQLTQRARRSFGTLVALAKLEQQLVPTGAQHALLPFTSIGRSPTNSIVINNTFASGEHATITLRDGQWWLEDRKSTNGTRLNDEPVTASVIVTDGDIIGIGNSYFRINLEA